MNQQYYLIKKEDFNKIQEMFNTITNNVDSEVSHYIETCIKPNKHLKKCKQKHENFTGSWESVINI